MKRIFLSLAAAAALYSAQAPAQVGVSISVGDPNFYGRIDIGDFPRPQLIYPQPVVIQPVPVGVVYEPVYMRVRPDHARDWRHHCARYGACGRPVYFVQDRWYNDVYAPRYRERRGHDGHPGKGWAKGHDKGHGKGHGKGHDRDRD